MLSPIKKTKVEAKHKFRYCFQSWASHLLILWIWQNNVIHVQLEITGLPYRISYLLHSGSDQTIDHHCRSKIQMAIAGGKHERKI